MFPFVGSRALFLIRWISRGLVCVVGLLTSVSASASEEVPRVEVRCSRLESEKADELVARLVGEMLVQGLSSAYLILDCPDDRVSGELDWENREIRRFHLLDDDPVFEQLHRLSMQLIDSTSAARIDEGANSHPNSEPTEKQTLSASRSESTSLTPFRPAWAIGAAIDSQITAGVLGGLVGPRFEVGVQPFKYFGTGVFFSHYFPLRRVDDFGVHDSRVGLDLLWVARPWLRLGGEFAVSIVAVSEPSGFSAPSNSGSSVRLALGAFLELAPQFSHWEPYIRGGASWVNAERIVAVEGVPLLTIPQFQALLTVGLRFRREL